MASVRPEYLKLAHGFPELAGLFGCAIPAAAQRDLVDFTLAMECVDRELDAIADPARRQALARAVLSGALEDASAELTGRVTRLHQIAPPPLWAAARRALQNIERMRATRDAREYVACVEEEGRLTVEMTLALVGPWCSPPLVRFLHRVAELANLVDKLIDARADHARGEIALRPGLRVHARLFAALLRRLPGALASHPNWPRFAAWGLSFLLPMLRAAAATPDRSESAPAGPRADRPTPRTPCSQSW